MSILRGCVALCLLLGLLGHRDALAQTVLRYDPGSFTLSQGSVLNIGPLALTMQNDGNLVLSRSGATLWSSGTGGQNCGTNQCVAKFQSWGDFAVYNGSTVLWDTSTSGNPTAVLVLSSQLPYIEVMNASILYASSYQFSAGNLTLSQGASLTIGPLALTMQDDGNLVLYQNGVALWNTDTGGQNCSAGQCSAVFQSDGNLVVYNGPLPFWASNTGGNPAATLLLSSQTPHLRISAADQSLLFANSYQFSAGNLTLRQGDTVNAGPAALTMRSDGNLVLYQNGAAVWSTGLQPQDCSANQCLASFQSDGNLVIYNGSTPLWASSTNDPTAVLTLSAELPHVAIVGPSLSIRYGPSQSLLYASSYLYSAGGLVLHEGEVVNMGPLRLTMQTDGNLVLSGSGTVLWNAGTGGQYLNCANQCVATFQSDGNFVVYLSPNTIWASNTSDLTATLEVSDYHPYIKVMWRDTRHFVVPSGQTTLAN